MDELPSPRPFDSDTMRADLARIREKLRRLEGERLTTVANIDRAMRDATNRLDRRGDEPRV